MRKQKKQRGFKQAPPKFFYKEDIFLSRMASILKIPQSKVKGLFFQKHLTSIKLNGVNKAALEKKGLELKEIEWSKNTYIVKNLAKSIVKNFSEYKKRMFYIQNPATIIATTSLEISSKNMVLDMYPTSETAHLLSFTEDGENVYVNQDSRIGENLDKEHSNSFDKVLLISPSSREGEITFLQKRPLKSWNIQKTKVLSKLQKKLICVGFNCLKKGGLLVYSTTTLCPNENEAVVTHLLKENKNAVLEDINLVQSKEFENYKTFVQKGLKEWNNEVFHPDIVKTIRTIPGKTMYGTYTALIRKV